MNKKSPIRHFTWLKKIKSKDHDTTFFQVRVETFGEWRIKAFISNFRVDYGSFLETRI